MVPVVASGPLIGREQVLRELELRLAESRCLTLTGPGGIGKTTIARTVGRTAAGAHPVCWVDLTGVTTVAGLAQRVATVLGVRESAYEHLDDAIDADLATTQGLLVLDNAEELDAPGPWIGGRLQRSPHLRVLSTSRRPLHVPGEVLQPVAGLALPRSAEPEDVATSPAGRLFLERAGAVGRALGLDAPTARDLAALLARLDGMPLAIELAAGRSRVLTPRAILERLGSETLLERPRDAGGRHGSLRTVLGWSLNGLAQPQRDLLDLLAVWVGPIELEAIEALAGSEDVIDDLDVLVELGLVQSLVAADGCLRFQVLETIRDAIPRDTARASARTLATLLTDRLDGWTASLAAVTPDGGEWFERSRPTVDHLVERLSEFEPDGARALAAASAPYWHRGGILREPLEQMQAATNSSNPDVRIRAHLAASMLATALEAGGAGREAAERALDLARSLGNVALELSALYRCGIAAVHTSDVAGARYLGDALRLAEALGRDADVLLLRHHLADMGQPAREALDALLALEPAVREAADPMLLASLLNDLAANEMFVGHDAQALAHADEAVRLLEDQGHSVRAAWTGLIGARAATRLGVIDDARRRLVEAGSVARGRGPSIEGFFLANALPLVVRFGLGHVAARLVGARDAHYARTGQTDTPDEQAMWDRDVAAARRLLNEVAWRVECDAGAAAPLEAVVGDALAAITAARPDSAAAGFVPGLTPREVEILSLVGRGMSDAEIASALFISPKTASVHLSNVKAKLEVATRLEAAMKARELGLVARAH